MRQIIRMNKMLIYFILGIIIIIFRIELKKYLYLVVGIPVLVLAIEGMTYEILTKSYLKKHNHIGAELLRLILSVIIIFFLKNDLILICIIWGIIAILSSTREFGQCIYKLTEKRSIIISIQLLESIFQTVFAILLIIDPEEHVNFHLILLGVEMELEASRILFSYLYNYKVNKSKELLN